MTNVMATIEMTNANAADVRGSAASDDVFALAEYSIHAENGEPEGDVFAEDAAEAAQLWAMENLHDGQYRLLQVMEGCTRCGWFQVERDADSATAKAWRP